MTSGMPCCAATRIGAVVMPTWACQFMSPMTTKARRLSFFSVSTDGRTMTWSTPKTSLMRTMLRQPTSVQLLPS